MSHDGVFLNEYGELVDAKISTTRPQTISPSVEREKCDICGRSVDVIYTACRACNDGRAYCSDTCFDQHRRRKHYDTEFCAECGSKLPKRYTFSSKLNSAIGKQVRFCGGSCLDRYWDKNICAECGSELPNTFKYADDIDRAMGKHTGFCSSYCLQKYRRKQLCAECGCKTPSTYTYADDIDRAKGDRIRFCSSYCAKQYRRKELCAECSGDLPSTYKYCKRCGSSQYRFCGSYCFDRHWNRNHA